MSEKNLKSRRLAILNPCTRDWDAMLAIEKGRYCQHCKIDVLDSPLITRGELLRTAADAKRSGRRVCVRIHRDVSGRTIFRSSLKHLPIFGVLFALVLPAARAQGIETNYGDFRVASSVTAIIYYIEGICGDLTLLFAAASASALSVYLRVAAVVRRPKSLLCLAIFLWILAFGMLALKEIFRTFFAVNVAAEF